MRGDKAEGRKIGRVVNRSLAWNGDAAARGTPLCPAGHLPHKEGDLLGAMVSPNNDQLMFRTVVERD
ncbi:hypothetical protein RCCGE510_18276 [Rhizobium sp. CCGE 510]|nr:hypothetical protein RCCGE510_18276 [Rhizobium sp. CCGE 510]